MAKKGYMCFRCGHAESDDIEDCVYAIIGEGFAMMNTEDGWVGSRSTLCPNTGYWFVNQCDDIEFTFEDCFPTSLGAITLATDTTEVEYVVADLTLRYTLFKIRTT